MSALGVRFATCGGLGHVPIAPGTAGSLAGLALYGLTRVVGGVPLQIALLAVTLPLGVWASSAAERHFGQTDPGAAVIDEVAGMLLALVALQVDWFGALAGFVAFRFFDVVKPFPARAAERLRGGWGIMADDVVAGLYAHGALRLLLWLVPPAAVT